MVGNVGRGLGPGVYRRRGRAGQFRDRGLECELGAATRVGYSLGRIRMFPRVLTRIHPVFKTPSVAVHAQAILAISYALILGFALGAPLEALALQGTISTVLIVLYLHLHRRELRGLLSPRASRPSSTSFLHLLDPTGRIGSSSSRCCWRLSGVDFAGLGIKPLRPRRATPRT